MSSRRTKFYLDKQNAKWSGVCAGMADYTGVDVMWIRLAAILITVSGPGIPWIFIAYWAAAHYADAKPAALYGDRQDEQFWQGVRQSPTRTTRDVKSRFRELDRRLADMELYYTSSNRALSNEIESLR